MSEVLTVIGGFVTGRDVLESVANTAVEMELVDDAEVVVFRKAVRMDNWKEKVDGRLVITHSAGALAIRDGMRPKQWVAYNGPEPRSPLGLAGAAMRKTSQHLYHAVAGPHRSAYARTIHSNNVEFALHGYDNLRHIPQISRTSTLARLAMLQESGVSVAGIVTEGDVFFPHDPLKVPRGVKVDLLPGGHDELLVDPATMLAAISARTEL
jgi:hypothetical protein